MIQVAAPPRETVAERLAEIEHGIRIFLAPNHPLECNLFGRYNAKSKPSHGGFFNDASIAIAAKGILQHERDCTGAYVTINPVIPAVRAQRADTFEKCDGRANANEIAFRHTFGIDFDPVRPSKTAADDSECEAAEDACQHAKQTFNDWRWPTPFEVHSGNGRYLLFRTHQPNDEDTKELFAKALKGAAKLFGNERVSVDTGIFDAPRLMRIPGTWNRKGSNCPDLGRVHRRCRLISEPEVIEELTRDQLEHLASFAPVEEPPKPKAAPATRKPTTAASGYSIPEYPMPEREERFWKVKGGTAGPYIADGQNSGEKMILADMKLAFRMGIGRDNQAFFDSLNEFAQPQFDPKELAHKIDDAEKFVGDEFGSMLTAIAPRSAKSATENTATHPVGRVGRVGSLQVKPEKNERTFSAKLIRMRDVVAEEVQWLWYKRVPLGKVSQFAGNGGLGKSYVALDIVARVTNGSPWPDVASGYAPLGNALILNSEDGLADTIKPRLDALGADTSRVYFLESIRSDVEGDDYERPFSLKEDIDRLKKAALDIENVKIIVIDPISSYLGTIDHNKQADVRMVLDPLKGLAEATGAAVLMINHLTKGSGPAVYRSCGSIAIQSMVRTSWAFAADREEPLRRLILPTKSNIGPDVTGMAYRIVDGRIDWEPDAVTITADEALEYQPRSSGSPKATERAEDWLEDRLKGGEVESVQLFQEAAAVGLKERTIWRAKKELGIIPRKAYGVKNGPWYWTLPVETEPCQTENPANSKDDWQTSESSIIPEK